MTHTINSWLNTTQNGDLKMRVWLMERAIDDCHTKGEANLDPAATRWLVTEALAKLWEFAWQVYFKGNEEAAWESLERFVAGRSHRFVVTVFSRNLDGLLLVVTDVADEVAAFQKVATLHSAATSQTWAYARLSPYGEERNLLAKVGDTGALDTDYLTESYEMEGGPEDFYEMCAAKLVFNQNLTVAVGW